MPAKAAIHAIIHGRVQGVYFRFATKKKAGELGVTGTVRNLPGGTSVEVIAEGDSTQLEALLEFLKEGPHGARVTKTEVSHSAFTGSYTGFEVIH